MCLPPPPPAEVASLDKRKTNKNFKSLILLNTVRKEIKYSGEIEILHKLVYDTTRITVVHVVPILAKYHELIHVVSWFPGYI